MLSNSNSHFNDNFIYFEKIQETDYISGTLIDVSDFIARCSFTRLKFQKGTEEFYVAAKKGTIIDERLNRLHPHRFKDYNLTIKRKGDLFYFYEDVEKDVLLGIIGLSINWTEEEEKEWEENKAYGFDYEKQAVFYGRTIEDVQNQYNDKIFRLELIKALTSTSKGTLNSIAIDGYRGILSFGVAISPKIIAKDNDNASYYGESICKDGSTQVTSLDKTLFSLKKDQLDELLNRLNNNFYDIPPASGKDALLQHPFFADKVKDGESISIWIKLEDAGNNTFSSYSYVLGDSRDDINHFLEKREPDLLRHIMYLRSLQTEYLLKSNEIARQNTKSQAIHSAIATIMSRNMSHNLGSHVLYYTQRDLIDKSNEIDTEISQLIELFPNLDDDVFCGSSEARKISTDKIKNILEREKNIPISSSLRGASWIVSLLKNRTNYVAAVAEDIKYPSLPVPFDSEIWKILTIDDKEEKLTTVNYYLKNIIRSEGFTRDKTRDNLHGHKIRLEWDIIDNLSAEEREHLVLSLPGGAIAIQAILNIFENFIRNSAKYGRHNGAQRRKDIVFTVRLTTGKDDVKVLIYDNNADERPSLEDTIDTLNGKIHNLKILNEDGAINKDDKGIKEMVLSYLWLRSSSYKDSLSTLISKLDARDNNSKQIVDSLKSSFKYRLVGNDNSPRLGLEFVLPLHHVQRTLDNKTFENSDAPLIPFSADVVSAPKALINEKKLSSVFPRITVLDDVVGQWIIDKNSVSEDSEDRLNETQELFRAISSRFCDNNDKDGIDKYKLWMDRTDNDSPPISEMPRVDLATFDKSLLIYFCTHLNSTPQEPKAVKEFYDNYAYVDSISGANYTKSLEHLLESAITDKLIIDTWANKDLVLKVKEAAMTRITIIDERLFWGVKRWIDFDTNSNADFEIKESQIELSLKNIRVLNWADSNGVKNSPDRNRYHNVDEQSLFCGNEFRRVGPYANKPNKTTFLSIHLGLIEEMLKCKDNEVINAICGDSEDQPLSDTRIQKLMGYLSEVFSPDFVCVHSGRGGLSAETENTILKQYPFIPFSTLESVFNDSKFLLSQMFYSIKYSAI